MQFHQEMFDQQLAIELGHKQGMGIADMLIRQLGHQSDSPPPQKLFNERGPIQAAESVKGSARMETSHDPAGFETPEAYIQYMRPLAEKVAAGLGVKANVFIAQSALETGWGNKIIRNATGESSHNLFGIKARKDWQGPSARVSTLEYMDGTMHKTRDSFRMYDSFKDSFEDYADFLMSNPRYQDALINSKNSSEFISALQTAGYATDPEYADKVIDIMDRHSI